MSNQTSRWRQFLALGVSILIACVILEIGARAFFATQVGPSAFLYGTEWFRNVYVDDFDARRKKTRELNASEERSHNEAEDRTDSVEKHSLTLEGYTKYLPHERKTTRDVDTDERIPVRINQHGFRGPDFEIEKAPGTVRILTAGSSSTFGFYNRDEETYPSQLERLLDEGCDRSDVRFEVINFAIPHASSRSLAAMLLAEGIDLDPDLITYYQGRNDSGAVRKYEGLIEKAYSVLVHRLIVVALLDQILVGDRLSVTAGGMKLGPFADMRSEAYLGNLDRIRAACEERDIQFLVANQQATGLSPFPRAAPEREPLRGVTYGAEASEIRARFDAGETVTAYEYSLLVHARLMADLEVWAEETGTPFVDIIGALDQDRHLLLSWVHLHPEANRVIAAELAREILPRYCKPASDPSAADL